jgi:hypothetical protein
MIDDDDSNLREKYARYVTSKEKHKEKPKKFEDWVKQQKKMKPALEVCHLKLSYFYQLGSIKNSRKPAIACLS